MVQKKASMTNLLCGADKMREPHTNLGIAAEKKTADEGNQVAVDIRSNTAFVALHLLTMVQGQSDGQTRHSAIFNLKNTERRNIR